MDGQPLCSLRELEDGTYSLNDLLDMHEALDFRDELRRRAESSKKKR